MLGRSRLACLAYLSWHAVKFHLFHRSKDGCVSNYFFEKIERASISDSERRCVIKWLLSGALAERAPDRLLRVYKLLRNLGQLTLRNETAIAIFESAVWLEDREIAEQLLLSLSAVRPALSASTINRLRQLHSWRFKRDSSKAELLLSPLTPADYFLPYLYFFARGVIADTLQKKEDALSHYRQALTLLPQGSREYGYALERCNQLLTELAVDP